MNASPIQNSAPCSGVTEITPVYLTLSDINEICDALLIRAQAWQEDQDDNIKRGLEASAWAEKLQVERLNALNRRVGDAAYRFGGV